MEPFPEDITKFLDSNIESIDQLEILRILGEDREKVWNLATLAGEVQAQPQTLRGHLAAMHGRGLLATTTQGTGIFCQYGVGTPELEDMVSRLLQLYKERPVTMIKLVYARTKDPLRDFADAFRLRKED